eukprot:Colp12_sorted_trinity150504_noHs@23142
MTRTIKSQTEYAYFRVQLKFGTPVATLEPSVFKNVLLTALRNLHGQVGASMQLDVLQYNAAEQSAILRVFSRDATKLWTALSMLSSYDNKPCVVVVHDSAPDLTDLVVNSSTFYPVPTVIT